MDAIRFKTGFPISTRHEALFILEPVVNNDTPAAPSLASVRWAALAARSVFVEGFATATSSSVEPSPMGFNKLFDGA